LEDLVGIESLKLMDFKGNEYFYEVFEKQRPTFGINYRELNRLMMASKAYEREF
jgi:hypothetical protein